MIELAVGGIFGAIIYGIFKLIWTIAKLIINLFCKLIIFIFTFGKKDEK